MQTGEKGDYVVKWRGSAESWPGALVNELWGAFIGLELDLPIAEAVNIHISEDFVSLLQNRPEIRDWAAASIGYNFGSVYEGIGFQEIVPGQSVSAGLRAKLADMFAFDLLIGNPDRRVKKPNFLSNGKDLLIFDQEMAFSFVQVLPFARNPKPWEILPSDMDWISNNFCFQQLKGSQADFTDFTGRLERLNQAFWQKATFLTPDAWRNENMKVIQHYVNQIVSIERSLQQH